jgi:hypothetical protein
MLRGGLGVRLGAGVRRPVGVTLRSGAVLGAVFVLTMFPASYLSDFIPNPDPVSHEPLPWLIVVGELLVFAVGLAVAYLRRPVLALVAAPVVYAVLVGLLRGWGVPGRVDVEQSAYLAVLQVLPFLLMAACLRRREARPPWAWVPVFGLVVMFLNDFEHRSPTASTAFGVPTEAVVAVALLVPLLLAGAVDARVTWALVFAAAVVMAADVIGRLLDTGLAGLPWLMLGPVALVVAAALLGLWRPRWLIRVHAARAYSRRERWLVRRRSRGWPFHQASRRMTLRATALKVCSRRVLGSPRWRAWRVSVTWTAWAMVDSTPARRAYLACHALVVCSVRAWSRAS